MQPNNSVAPMAVDPSASAERGTEKVGATPPIGDRGTKGEATQVGAKCESFAATNDLASDREGLGCHLESILCSPSLAIFLSGRV